MAKKSKAKAKGGKGKKKIKSKKQASLKSMSSQKTLMKVSSSVGQVPSNSSLVEHVPSSKSSIGLFGMGLEFLDTVADLIFNDANLIGTTIIMKENHDKVMEEFKYPDEIEVSGSWHVLCERTNGNDMHYFD